MKPWQKGMLLTTNSILGLYRSLMAENGYSFLITGRFSQDCLENLFSQVRGLGDAHPSSVRFRHNLRHITLSHLVAVPKNSFYETDEASLNLLDVLKESDKPASIDELSPAEAEFIDGGDMFANANIEGKAHYYVSGWAAFKAKEVVGDCEVCLVLLQTAETQRTDASFTKAKSYGGLVLPTDEVCDFLLKAENHFRTTDLNKANVHAKLCKKMLGYKGSMNLAICKRHDLRRILVNKYFTLRLHIRASFLNAEKKKKAQYASRSAAARTTIL